MISVHDTDFTIVRSNKAFASFMGRSCEELVGLKCFDLLHGTGEPWVGCPHREACETNRIVTREVNDPNNRNHNDEPDDTRRGGAFCTFCAACVF